MDAPGVGVRRFPNLRFGHNFLLIGPISLRPLLARASRAVEWRPTRIASREGIPWPPGPVCSPTSSR